MQIYIYKHKHKHNFDFMSKRNMYLYNRDRYSNYKN